MEMYLNEHPYHAFFKFPFWVLHVAYSPIYSHRVIKFAYYSFATFGISC